MSLESARLAVLSHRMVPADPATADAWYRFQEAIDAGWIDLPTLDRLIDGLGKGVGHGVEELDLEVEGDELVVTMVQHAERCDLASFLAALKALAAATRGEGGGAGEAAGVAAGKALAAAMSGGSVAPLAESGTATGTAGATDATGGEAGDLAGLVGKLRDALLGAQATGAIDAPDGLREPVALAREVARRLRAGESMDGLPLPGEPTLSPADADRIAALAGKLEGAAAEALAADPDALAKAGRSFTRWLGGDASAGQELDAIIAKLDALTDGLAGPDPAAADAARNQRLREGARASIAASLKRFGIGGGGAT